MIIRDVSFVKSSQKVSQCPEADKPEYAFIGRSNVGKSSLINMLMERNKLAKVSGKPGKTQLINHFTVNNGAWYLVDLPGYGYAKVSKSQRKEFQGIITDYISQRKNLVNLFLLVDARHEPQKIDLAFMEWLGETEIPFSIVFTKIDKLSSNQLQKSLARYRKIMLMEWEEMPPTFRSSATSSVGREEILGYIESLNEQMTDYFTNQSNPDA